MRRIFLWLVLPVVLLCGCETRLSHIEAVNDYRVQANKLKQLKAERSRIIAASAGPFGDVPRPANLGGYGYVALSHDARLAELQREAMKHHQDVHEWVQSHVKDLEAQIAEIEPAVKALKARLGEHADDYLNPDYRE
jgi:hypothetical protein